MGVFQTGFEFPSLVWLRQKGWDLTSVSFQGAGTESFPQTHLTSWGAGGAYSILIENSSTSPRFGDSDTNRWAHFWFRRQSLAGGSNVNVYFRNLDQNGGINATVQFQADSNGAKVRIYRGNSTVVATSVASLDNSIPHWVEIEMRCQNSPDGLCNVYVDGVLFVSFSGGDLRQLGADGWNALGFDTSDIFLDDLIITDVTEGRLTEEYYGFRQPLSGDQSTALTPSEGSENYRNVTSPFLDTSTYNATTAGAGIEDLYETRRTHWVDEVYGIQLSAYVARTGQYASAGNNSQLAVRSGSTTETSATSTVGASDYQPQVAFFPENPDTTSPWTESDLEDLAVGVNTAT